MSSRFAVVGTVLFALVGTAGAEWVWKRLDKPSPPSMFEHKMVYDSHRQRVVVFGGLRYYTESSGYVPVRDVWEFDGREWHLMPNSRLPTSITGGGLAFDSRRGVTVYFGGHDSNGNEQAGTFEWDGASWTEREFVKKPSPRRGCNMTYDSARGVCLLFGGELDYEYYRDTWEYDGKEWRTSEAIGPSARAGVALAFDSRRQMVVLHGGWPSPGDTWEWMAILGSE
jgi:hypothetical protein